MNRMNLSENSVPEATNPWLAEVEGLLARGQKAAALRYLDGIIEAVMPLFKDDPELREGRHLHGCAVLIFCVNGAVIPRLSRGHALNANCILKM